METKPTKIKAQTQNKNQTQTKNQNQIKHPKLKNNQLHKMVIETNLNKRKEIKLSKYISLITRKMTLNPGKACCQFKDPTTNRTGGSQKFLQIDHIQPRWAGGLNNADNFQVLCAQHNQYRYKIQAGLLPKR